ncbi:hypothetical protein CPB85DRAFT_1514574 [Mucidula mucida]|nr:hypothetical protein CPB85DRAFT_1514574 [Mucidula mucida]
MTQIQYRLSNLLDFQILPQYTKPNNPNFEELEASYNAWIDAAEFLSAPHKHPVTQRTWETFPSCIVMKQLPSLQVTQLLADGVVQEALDRESTQPITVEAAVPFLDLARWTFDIDLPEETLKHPVLREMEEATVDLVLWPMYVDIYSYRKEYLEDGAPNSYVTVTMKDPNVPVADGDHQAAIDIRQSNSPPS